MNKQDLEKLPIPNLVMLISFKSKRETTITALELFNQLLIRPEKEFPKRGREVILKENFLIVLLQEREKSIEMLSQLEEGKLKKEIINYSFQELLIGKQYSSLKLINALLDETSRDSAITYSFKAIVERSPSQVESVLNLISDKDLENSLIADSFKKICENLPKRAFEFLNKLTDKKLKDKKVTSMFKMLLDIDQEKSFQELEYITNTSLRDQTVVNTFPILFAMNGYRAIELLNKILDNWSKESLIANSYNMIIEFDQEVALKLLNSISDKNLKEKAISNAFSTLIKKDFQEAFNLLYSISNIQLQDSALEQLPPLLIKEPIEFTIQILSTINHIEWRYKVGVNTFQKLFQLNIEKAFELFDALSDENLKNKIANKMFRTTLAKNIPKAFKLLDNVTEEALKDKIIEEHFQKMLKVNPKKTLDLIDLISNDEIKEKIQTEINKANNREKERNLLEPNSNISKEPTPPKKKKLTKLFIETFQIDQKQAFKQIKSIKESSLKNYILENSIEAVMDIDSNSAEKLIHLSSTPEKKKLLWGKYLKKLLKINKYKVFLLIDSISDPKLQKNVVDNLFSKLFREDRVQPLQHLHLLPNDILKNRVITLFFTKFSSRMDKKSLLILLNSITKKELRREHIQTLFTQLLKEGRGSIFKLFSLISDKELANKILTNSIKNLLRIDREKTLELYQSLKDNPEVSLIFFQELLRRDTQQALDFLNSISDEKLKKDIIIDSFELFFKKNKDKAFELLAFSYFTKEAKYRAVNNIFYRLVEIDRFMALETLRLFPKQIADKIIMNNLNQLIRVYMNNGKIKYKIFELVGILHEKNLKNQVTTSYFHKFFSVNSTKAITNLAFIEKETQDKIVIKFFPNLLKSNKKESIRLLKKIENRKDIERTISQFFKEIFLTDKNLAIKLLQTISSHDIQNKIIVENFPLLVERYAKKITRVLNLLSDKKIKKTLILEASENFLSTDITMLISLLSKLDNSELKETIIIDSCKRLAEKSDISKIITLINKTASPQLREIIQFRYQYLIQENREKHIKLLNEIQYSLKNEIEESVIAEAHNAIHIAENKDNELKLDLATPELLSFLLINEQNNEEHQKLLSHLIEKITENSAKKDYSKLAYRTIEKSKIFKPYLYDLEPFISTLYFKEQLKDFKHKKEAERNINRMLGKVLSIHREKRENVFMNRFRQQHKIKNIHAVIPTIAKVDFELAQALVEKVNRKDLQQEIQETIFLDKYQSKFIQAIMAYNKIHNFYIKVALSKVVLESFVPEFTHSFFIEAMMILDSQNIAQTPMELVSIAPKELLIYYGEVEDDKESLLSSTIESIKELQQQADKAEEFADIETLETLDLEAIQLKKSIQEREKLFNLFLEHFNMNRVQFARLNLFDFKPEKL